MSKIRLFRPSKTSPQEPSPCLSSHCSTLYRFCQYFIAILTVFTSIFLAATPVSATTYSSPYSSVNNFYFDDFTANYYLYRAEDGTSRMMVVEELTAVFPDTNQNHGFTRVIPFTNNNGKNLTMESDDTIYIDVQRNGVEEPVDKVELGNGYFTVYIGDADTYVHGEQHYTLTYEFRNLIRDFDGWQELYWDTNGNDWSQRFNHLSAYVYLDESIAKQFTGDTACYVGRFGDSGQNRCQTSTFQEDVDLADGRKSLGGVKFSTDRLAAGENLTFDLKFQPGTFAAPPQKFDHRLIACTVAAAILGSGLIILIILCLRQTSENHRYYKSLFVKPEYTVPEGFTVAEMAANYIGKGAGGNRKVATLLDLAVQHKIELVKTEKDGAFGKKKTQWMVRIKTDTLNKQQATVLKILAGSVTPLRKGQEIYIKTHTSTPGLVALGAEFDEYVETALKAKGLAVDKNQNDNHQSKKSPNFASILIISSVLWMIAWVFIFAWIFSDAPSYVTIVGEDILPPILITLVVALFFISVFIGVKNAKFATHTQKGLEYSRYLDGLRTYMKMAEAERLQFLQSVKGADTSHQGIVKLYEKLLPYAAIFKLEKSWLDELGKYYEFDDVGAPTWYMGVGVFSAREFASAMNAVSSSASSSINYSTSSGSSSSSSGFGGGGFSGGGGGGGGGGGW